LAPCCFRRASGTCRSASQRIGRSSRSGAGSQSVRSSVSVGNSYGSIRRLRLQLPRHRLTAPKSQRRPFPSAQSRTAITCACILSCLKTTLNHIRLSWACHGSLILSMIAAVWQEGCHRGFCRSWASACASSSAAISSKRADITSSGTSWASSRARCAIARSSAAVAAGGSTDIAGERTSLRQVAGDPIPPTGQPSVEGLHERNPLLVTHRVIEILRARNAGNRLRYADALDHACQPTTRARHAILPVLVCQCAIAHREESQ
jgi:hypothetical protein